MNNSEARKKNEPVLPSDHERIANTERTVLQIERLCLRIIRDLRSPDDHLDDRRGPIVERDED